ncbi:lipocalin family protein [Aquimarina sp. 2201CG14-23]|uniref:lipocalin family protein n=1 Tax=Aquimarina mycalae TaxID=3040073 RepID=UPI0024781F40|nr:lipocalin family protein [Aquimarina sp. 2201CG14-23]MDH7447716.1 lipocalin family protein [Aquimarina sp. 2201CG14-23]
MKKIILLFAVSISICITSCQTDDDAGPADTKDKFIGSWKITQEFENGIEVTVETCTLQDVLTIKDDQNLTSTSYIAENGTCKLEETLTGTWENLGDNKYKITPEIDEVEATITFSGNTMTVETTDEEGDFKQILARI